jgi:D-beta-D-heptose 7-phosphate kinase/D-beta-D-heptose 1-phosphate adenosyltransferase
MAKRKILVVIGDLMLDKYTRGRVDRISPEAPVQVVNVDEVDYKLGGAGNVASNLRALGADVKLLGIVGDDYHALIIRDLMQRQGIVSGLVVERGRPTTVKERIVAHGQQMLRIDVETSRPIDKALCEMMLGNLESNLSGPIIISDYNKGAVRPDVIALLCERVNIDKRLVIVAPKTKYFSSKLNLYDCVYAIVMNHYEAEGISGIKITNNPSCARALKRVRKFTGCGNVVITRSEAGMSLFDGKDIRHIPSLAQEVYNVTGAGDTVVATIAQVLSDKVDLFKACTLANKAASLVIAKQGTATITYDELMGE